MNGLVLIFIIFLVIIGAISGVITDAQSRNQSGINRNRTPQRKPSNDALSNNPFSINFQPRSQFPKETSHAHHEPVGNFEERHADRIGSRLVKHIDPEPGYVVLNGVKRRISDCKNL